MFATPDDRQRAFEAADAAGLQAWSDALALAPPSWIHNNLTLSFDDTTTSSTMPTPADLLQRANEEHKVCSHSEVT